MKVKELIGHSFLTKGQYITVVDRTNGIEYSSENIGRYDFGKNQETVLKMKVNSFRPTEYGIHIDAEAR